MSGELSIMLPPERVGLLGFKGLQYDTRVVHRVGGRGSLFLIVLSPILAGPR